MQTAFSCPKCDGAVSSEFSDATTSLTCSHCGQELSIPAGAVVAGRVERCLACPSKDLFLRKDFPQRLGVAIVVVGIIISTATWAMERPLLTYAVLFATALIDLVLYVTMPDALMCYRCGALYRGCDLTEHEGFNLETHERYRQQAARLAERKGAVPTTSTHT